MLVLNLPFKALMFLTLMRPSLVLFLVLWLKLVKDFLRSEERFSRNAETDLVCRLLLEKKKDECKARRRSLTRSSETEPTGIRWTWPQTARAEQGEGHGTGD